jgi:hypothetical protein
VDLRGWHGGVLARGCDLGLKERTSTGPESAQGEVACGWWQDPRSEILDPRSEIPDPDGAPSSRAAARADRRLFGPQFAARRICIPALAPGGAKAVDPLGRVGPKSARTYVRSIPQHAPSVTEIPRWSEPGNGISLASDAHRPRART